jgi:hypothetical protein
LAAELNRDTIKDAFVTLLQSNSDLYDATGADSKIRKITTGRPNDELNDSGIPYIFVRNARGTFENIRRQDLAISGASKIIQHELFFEVVVVAIRKNSKGVENALDDFQELILETLEGDQDIGGSVDTSDPIRVADYPIPSIATGKQGRIITVRCTKVTT